MLSLATACPVWEAIGHMVEKETNNFTVSAFRYGQDQGRDQQPTLGEEMYK